MSSNPADWPFDDPPNTAVFANVRILDGGTWIKRVAHDLDDGAWQFHPPDSQSPMHELIVVSLRRIVELDPSIAELADLEPGWVADREGSHLPWRRRLYDDDSGSTASST